MSNRKSRGHNLSKGLNRQYIELTPHFYILLSGPKFKCKLKYPINVNNLNGKYKQIICNIYDGIETHKIIYATDIDKHWQSKFSLHSLLTQHPNIGSFYRHKLIKYINLINDYLSDSNIIKATTPIIPFKYDKNVYLSSAISLRTTDECQQIKLLPADYSDNANKIKSKLVSISSSYDKTCNVSEIQNILTEEECKIIITQCMTKRNGFQCMTQKYDKHIRSNSRLLTLDENISNLLWKRLKNVIINDIVNNNNLSTIPLGFSVLGKGEWYIKRLNNAIRINRYDQTQSFSIHKDGQYCSSANERSLFTLIVYLNDNFIGGETNFYLLKNIGKAKDKIIKRDWTTQEEVKYFGGLSNGYKCKTFIPKTGNGALFNHNVIHEAKPILKNHKFILKTDVIVHRINVNNIGFTISLKESNDYQKSLNYFREAQTCELNQYIKSRPKKSEDMYTKYRGRKRCVGEMNDVKDDIDFMEKANEFYERSMNLRYCYPKCLLSSNIDNECINCYELLSYASLDTMWLIIFEYLQMREIRIVTYLFPSELYPIFKLWNKNYNNKYSKFLIDKNRPKYIPYLFHSFGTHNIFRFDSSEFFDMNKDSCLKVCAIYTFYLMGNRTFGDDYNKLKQPIFYDKDYYVAEYNSLNQTALAVPFAKLLSDVFYDRQCYGSYFKIKKQSQTVTRHVDADQNDEKTETETSDNINFNKNVDRQYMSTMHDSQFVGGVNISDKMKLELTKNPGHYELDYVRSRCMNASGQTVSRVEGLYRYHLTEYGDYGSETDANWDQQIYNTDFEIDNPNMYMKDLHEMKNNNNKPHHTRIFDFNGHCDDAWHVSHIKNITNYNHLIFDFSKNSLNVIEQSKLNASRCHGMYGRMAKKGIYYTNSDNDTDGDNSNESDNNDEEWDYAKYCRNCYPKITHLTNKYVKLLDEYKREGLIISTEKYYTVNIENILDHKMSFFHAGECQIMPTVDVDMFGVGGYSHLTHIHVATMKNKKGQMFVWTLYNPIAAL